MSEFPAGWTRAALGDLADFTNGKAFKKEEWLEAGKPIIRIQNLNNPEASFNYADDSHEDKYLVRNGDLLVSWSASLGVYYWVGQDAWLNQHIFKVHSLRGCDKGFLKYALQTSIDDFYAKAHGMGMVHITKGNFESHQVSLPPLAEQTRIAQKLDELLAQVDTLKARIDAIPALLKRFRQSVLAAAVSGRLTVEWRVTTALEYTQDTDGYPEAPLDFVADFQNGYAFKSEWFSRSGDIQVAKIGNVRNNRADLTNSPAFVSSKIGLEYQRFMTVEGDLLLSMTGTKYKRDYGYACTAPVGILVNQRVGKLSPRKERIVTSFLLLCLQSAGFREQFFSGETGQVSQGNVGSEHIKKCLIPTPTLGEQTEIARRVEQLFAFADQLEAKVDSAKSRIDHLTQSILAKAFRGELVPQDPNDEPAYVLLERIKAQRAATPKTKRARKDA